MHRLTASHTLAARAQLSSSLVFKAHNVRVQHRSLHSEVQTALQQLLRASSHHRHTHHSPLSTHHSHNLKLQPLHHRQPLRHKHHYAQYSLRAQPVLHRRQHTDATIHDPPSQQSATLSYSPPNKFSQLTHKRSTTASTTPPLPSRTRRRLRRLLAAISALLIAYYTIPEFRYYCGTSLRFMRTLYTLAAIAADYKLYFVRNPNDETEEYERGLRHVHSRSAARLLALCMANKGLYIKTGQYLASMNHVLPTEFITTLRVLQDEAPNVSFDVVRGVISEATGGRAIEDLFMYFHSIPLAAASIAQVHYAILRNGDEVAVKIQYPQLRKDFKIDMFANWLTLKVGGWLFYNFDLEWLADELRVNLEKELDFCNEARNSERCQRQLEQGTIRGVRAPRIHWELTSTRMLCMEYVHGMKINDSQQQGQWGIDTKKAVERSIGALSEQIFLHGFCNADPHPGNIFVAPVGVGYKHPISVHAQQAIHDVDPDNLYQTLPGISTTKSIKAIDKQTTVKSDQVGTTKKMLKSTPFEIILLDHGLYREISEHTRISYCKLWEALILKDDQKVMKYSAELGVREKWEWFATGILMRPYRMKRMVTQRISKQDIDKMRKKAQKEIPAILQMSKDMPRELLLVMRNQNYLRSLNAEMGGIVNRFRIMARAAVRGIYYQRPAENAEAGLQQSLTPQHMPADSHHAALPPAMQHPHHKQRRRKRTTVQWWFRRLRFELYLAWSDLINSVIQLGIKWFEPDLMRQAQLPADDPNALPITG